ncbi:MAG: NAD(P)H-binding protein [Myxococcales bacterium]|nr:NAD(P)H-binding protein [Myxococcales bacterium]
MTGANGHLGQRLFRHLGGQAPRPELHAAVRSERAAGVLAALPAVAQPKTHLVDYLDGAAMEAAASGCRAVVHLVGILKEGSNSSYEDAHEGTTRVLAEAAARAGVQRIVYLSILGSRPDSPNACLASKGRGEQILLESAVPTTVLRVPMVLGPGEIAAHALRGRASAPFTFAIRGGRSLEQPIDGDDLVRAIVAALGDESGESRALDLAGPESIPGHELVRRAAEILGTSPRTIPIPLGLVRFAAACFERFSSDPPLTRAMLGVLDHDDAIDPEPACRALGIELTPLDVSLRRALETAP